MLLHIDLDHFKLVNDACGHLRGDEMLRRIAHLLRTRMRAGDRLARLGGDEFGLLLESCTADDAVRIGEPILNSLAGFRFSCGDMRFCIGASIGGVVVQAPCAGADTLMHQAETACRVAKHKGRNRVQIDTVGVRDAEWDHTGPQQWVSRLQAALDRDRFVLHCQKILAIADDADPAARYEILIRMRGDGGELVPPGAFMEHFRELGCRFALDDFGSGFSSFGYLKSLPVDFIKIDGGFVRNMIDEPLDLAVVRAIHDVAEVFGKRTIAEYVESGALLERLRTLGIDFAQGYHIERPAPLSEDDR